MDVEPKSLQEMGERGILKYWPSLIPSTYHKTSDEFKDYNCVAWVTRIKTENIDFSQDDEGNPVIDPYFLTSYPYIEYFELHGFELCDSPDWEEGFEKIAIYEKDGKFKHVASQLGNKNWTSKIGEFEDIEHYSLEALEGHPYKNMSYGKISLFMKRKSVF
jgi:hypothetical protein